MDWGDVAGKGAAGLAAIGTAAYAAIRMFRNDSRSDKNADTLDSATHQIIQTLREEVARLAERLETVETQHTKCMDENAAIRLEISALRKQVGATVPS